MRKFNPEKALKKIQRGKKSKIITFIFILLIVGVMGYSFALYQVRYSKRIIYTKVAPFSNKDINLAIFLDGKESEDNKFPSKGSGYYFNKVECDNDSNWGFDTTKWKLILEASGKDKCNVYFTKNYIDDSGANPPELYQGLIPVTIDGSGKIQVANLKENWYDYDAKQWANAVLVDASNPDIKEKYFNEDESLKSDVYNTEVPITDILQMYVWIPRYKYQLFNAEKGKTAQAQEIKIQFESGTLSTGSVSCITNDKGVETCVNAANNNWYTHPAFTFGSTELPGIWVGKFENSGSTTNLTIKPNLSSLRAITIGDIFNSVRNLELQYASRYNINNTEIDTHPMKNMEWGGVVYLTQSKYGRCSSNNCSSVWMNNNSSFTTGCAGDSADATISETCNVWTSINGVHASTTDNVYGIYDMSGGAWDYVMGNMVDEGGNYYKSDSTLTKPEEKYYDKYEYNTDRLNNQIGHLGDATRETLNWYGDAAAFVNGTASWFGRGLHHNNPYAAGIFGIFSDTGQALVYASSRSIITGEDK